MPRWRSSRSAFSPTATAPPRPEVEIDNQIGRSLAVRFDDGEFRSLPTGSKAFAAFPPEPATAHRLRVYRNDFDERPLCETALPPDGREVVVVGSAEGCRVLPGGGRRP